jgi:Inner membrane component of T3SS, cytoplasmic domain/Inner membrane component of T3SS, periplasmic domain
MSAGITRQENTPSKLELEVVGGFHSGVSLALEEGIYSIGSTPDADIVLRDHGVASEHALLRTGSHGLRIEAMGGDISIGNELITQGHGCKLRLPVDIVMGDARLRLSHPRSEGVGLLGRKLQPVGRFLSKRPFVAAGGLIVCALAVSVAARDVPPVKIPEAVDQPSIPGTKALYPGNIEMLSRFNQDEKVTQSTVAEAASYLSARLKALGITSLKVTTADKRILVIGTLNTRESVAWTSAQQWFDETYRGRVVLTANVAIGENMGAPTLRLQAIWFGERPYIITEEGRRLYEGARLDDGWVLQRIAEDRTILEKDGASLALTYR